MKKEACALSHEVLLSWPFESGHALMQLNIICTSHRTWVYFDSFWCRTLSEPTFCSLLVCRFWCLSVSYTYTHMRTLRLPTHLLYLFCSVIIHQRTVTVCGKVLMNFMLSRLHRKWNRRCRPAGRRRRVGGVPMVWLLGGFYDFTNPGEHSIMFNKMWTVNGNLWAAQGCIHQTEYLIDYRYIQTSSCV